MRLLVSKEGNALVVQFSGRKFIMDELELVYFLSKSVHGIGESKARRLLDEVNKEYYVEREIDLKLDTIPDIYMRTQYDGPIG